MSNPSKYRGYNRAAATAAATTAQLGQRQKKELRDSSAEDFKNERPDMTDKDQLVMLLHIGAEIEHSLMVQYLYAAYSLGNENVPREHREKVKRWQDDILAVAKEEMGHLLTVQNILTLLGAPTNLSRVDLPWDMPFYPFPFQLEPLTLDAVACYVYAEMPSTDELDAALKRCKDPAKLKSYRRFKDRDFRNINKIAHSRAAKHGGAHRVGGLYDKIVDLLKNTDSIRDHMFQENSYTFQASVDDWGRGYQPRPRTLTAGGSFDPKSPLVPEVLEAHVMVDRVATRGQAILAIQALSQQGEGPGLFEKDTGALSHFDRFLRIYQEFVDIKGKWEPARRIAVNPTTRPDLDPEANDYISAPLARAWASLFNVRYRILLKYLAHTFQLARVTPVGEPNLRAMVMHRVFAEMYNLKTIAGVLIRLPQHDPPKRRKGDIFCSGPPFEMPYNLDLAGGEFERWVMHQDLIHNSQVICWDLMHHEDGVEKEYLRTLFAMDDQAIAWMREIRNGLDAQRIMA